MNSRVWFKEKVAPFWATGRHLLCRRRTVPAPTLTEQQPKAALKPLRYLLVGGLCAGLNNAILITAAYLGVNVTVSLAVSFVIVGIIGYLAHSKVTFGERRSRRSFSRYAAAMLVNLPLTFVLLSGFGALHLPMIVAAPVTTVIALAFNYTSSRWAIASRRVAAVKRER